MEYVLATTVIEDLTNRITLTLVALFVAVAIFGMIIGIFVVMSRKQMQKSKGKSTLPRHNYARFNRADARDYIRFDDILDVGGDEHFGVLVDNNQSRFVCYIALQGFDYNLATKEEQYSAAMAMIGVINTIDSTIQVRQDARPSDFSIAIAECDKVIARTQEQINQSLIRGNSIYVKLKAMEEENRDEDDIEWNRTMNGYYSQLTQEKNEIEALNWIIEEQNAIKAQYTGRVDVTAETNAHKETLYIIDYYYNAAEHMNRELTTDERYDEAIQKLWSKSGAYISALSKAGVYARRLSGKEILETLRFHTHPYSTAQSKTADLDLSMKNLFTTSDFPETMKKAVILEQEQEEQRQKQIDEFYDQVGGYIPEDAPDIIPAVGAEQAEKEPVVVE